MKKKIFISYAWEENSEKDKKVKVLMIAIKSQTKQKVFRYNYI